MKNFLLSALLSGVVIFSSQPGVSAQVAKSTPQTLSGPEAVVREFYAWYLGRLNKDDYEPLKRRAEALKYLTPELHRKAPRLTADMGADIFICAQDWEPSWAENFTVAPPTLRGAKANTTVALKIGETESIKINVALRRVGAAWKIDGVSCAG